MQAIEERMEVLITPYDRPVKLENPPSLVIGHTDSRRII